MNLGVAVKIVELGATACEACITSQAEEDADSSIAFAWPSIPCGNCDTVHLRVTSRAIHSRPCHVIMRLQQGLGAYHFPCFSKVLDSSPVQAPLLSLLILQRNHQMHLGNRVMGHAASGRSTKTLTPSNRI